MSIDIRKEVLRFIKEDEEFRYAVAGAIGLTEFLKRLDRHEEHLVKLSEEMVRLGKEVVRINEELVNLREDTVRLGKDMVGLREDMVELRKDMVKLREDMVRGFDLLDRRIGALGARWEIMSEEAFKEGIKPSSAKSSA